MDMRLHRSGVLAACVAGPLLAGAGAALEPYVAPSKLYALHKPPGWKVTDEARPDSFAISVGAPDGSAGATLLWSRAAAGGKPPKALDLLKQVAVEERKRRPGATFEHLLVSKGGGRAAVDERFSQGGVAFQCRLFLDTDGRKWSLQAYRAREADLATQRPVLMNILMSVALIKAPRGGGAGAAPPPEPLAERRAPDGSLKLRVPRNWNFLAAKGRVITGAPDGSCGFIFTAFTGAPQAPGATVLQGTIGRPYLRPAPALSYILAGFGHRDIQVLQTTPDAATAAQYRATIRGGNCEVADVVAAWTPKGGSRPAMGAFKVLNSLPGLMGTWTCILAGIWGPREGFANHLPVLEQVAGSFGINDPYARSYIRAGLENLKRLQAQTAAAMRDLNYAREDLQKAWEARQARQDYMDSKWDDYRRGDSYWVSDLEGGKVYHTDTGGTKDTRTGDYYEGGGYTWTHFEGGNPRHPSETMREVSSYELTHGAPPP
jgi:hypothetical protein